MKRIILILALLLALVTTPAIAAEQSCQQSAQYAADALVTTGSGLFYGVSALTDATNDVTMNIYDNTAGSGTKLVHTIVFTTSADNRVQTWSIDPPVEYHTGIYVDADTVSAATTYMIFYKPK